jgi:hypothetical protein
MSVIRAHAREWSDPDILYVFDESPVLSGLVRGVINGLLLCLPFWIALYFLIF